MHSEVVAASMKLIYAYVSFKPFVIAGKRIAEAEMQVFLSLVSLIKFAVC